MGNLKVLSASRIMANPRAYFIGTNHHQQVRLAVLAVMATPLDGVTDVSEAQFHPPVRSEVIDGLGHSW